MGQVPGWLDGSPPLDSLPAVVGYLNDLGYNISWGRNAAAWMVLTGDQGLFTGSSPEEVEGFLYGMAVEARLSERNTGVSRRRGPRPAPPVHDRPLAPDGRWAGDLYDR